MLGWTISLLGRLRHDTRGAVMTEYAILVGTMAMAIVAAFIAGGPHLVSAYQFTRDQIARPFP
jgi:Flp pilus assembly pilin Flp